MALFHVLRVLRVFLYLYFQEKYISAPLPRGAVFCFLYSVYSVFFGIYIFKKKYTYTHTTYVTATWGRVFFCGEEKHQKSRSTRSTENGDMAGRRTTPLEADAQPPPLEADAQPP